MAISRERKTAKTDEPLFDQPLAQQFEDTDGERNTEEKVEGNKELEDLRAQLAQLQEDRERDRELDYLRPANNASQVLTVEPVYEDPNKVRLPDPAIDPEGYDGAIAARNEIRLTNLSKRDRYEAKKKSDLDAKINGLWEDFGDKYPDIAEEKERVEYVAGVLAQKAAKDGVDVQSYMFQSPKRFMKDLASKYEEIFGPVELQDDADNDPPPRANARRRASNRDREEADSGRSSGIFGGSGGGSRKTPKKDTDENSSMITELQDEQRKSGFF